MVCYFSTGTTEPFRQDYKDNEAAWTAVAAGKMAEWDESWLDITRLQELQALMEPRFQRAKAQGCDAVEPDNVDCYDNKGKGDQQGGDYERRQCICRVFLHGARMHSYTRLYIHAYTGALHTLIRPVSCPYREEGLLGYGVSSPSPPSCTESFSLCGSPLATTYPSHHTISYPPCHPHPTSHPLNYYVLNNKKSAGGTSRRSSRTKRRPSRLKSRTTSGRRNTRTPSGWPLP